MSDSIKIEKCITILGPFKVMNHVTDTKSSMFIDDKERRLEVLAKNNTQELFRCEQNELNAYIIFEGCSLKLQYKRVDFYCYSPKCTSCVHRARSMKGAWNYWYVPRTEGL